MNYASPFAQVEALNAMQELNAFFETSEDANIRRTFYELDDRILSPSEVETETTTLPDADNDIDDDISVLKGEVERGRGLLEECIRKYHHSKSALEQANQIQDIDRRRLSLIHTSFLSIDNAKFESAKQAFEAARDEVEKQNISKIAELKKGCDVLTTELQRMRSIYKIIKTSDSTFACPICLKTQVECFLNPCGHTYCHSCIQRAEDRCFICRKSYSRIHNLFFS